MDILVAHDVVCHAETMTALQIVFEPVKKKQIAPQADPAIGAIATRCA
jgi:hypothetical protein